MTAPEPQDLQAHLLSVLIQRATPPEAIYHYTRQAELIEILKSRKLWCTDIRYLNDARELTWAAEIASNVLTMKASAATDQRIKGLCDEGRRAVEFFPAYPLYVSSFSEDRDQLSQWRAYGQGGGYAIGFTSSGLMLGMPQAPFPGILLQCVYDVAEQQQILEAAIDYLVADFSRQPPHTPPEAYTHHFFGYLLVAGACFKHPKFAEEREWRLVFRARRPTLVGIQHFRVGRSTIVPYIEYPLAPEGQPLPLREVVVGPTPHLSLACDAVGQLMGNLEPHPSDAMVSSSTIPYRNW